MGELYLGTSGWSYKEWEGVFYQGKDWFYEYSQVFSTAEVNSTFYSYPSLGFIDSLIHRAPPGFLFSLKLPKQITHKKLLDLDKGVEDDLRLFLKLIQPLKSAGKLGALLSQLPPKSKAELWDNLKAFFKILPVQDYQFVIEFRHLSWLKDRNTWELLREHQVGYCIVDEPLLPAICEVTSSEVAYVRWHGRGERPWYYYKYSEHELKEWLPKLKKLMASSRQVFAYFNNHFRGFAPWNALQLCELLGEATDEQKIRLSQINEYFNKYAIEELQAAANRLLSEAKQVGKPPNLIELLSIFLDTKRLERAQEEQIEFITKAPAAITAAKIIRAKVKDYEILLDLEDRRILHNCEDWQKRRATKQFCKHIGGLFLKLAPAGEALPILIDIAEHLSEWQFD